MTNDKKLVQCEFGCGVNVYYQTVEFSDSLEIPIPREADDSIHNCPNLDRDELPDVFTPITDDQDLIDEFCQNADYLWNKEEIEKHYLDLDSYFAGIDGLEFKNYRDDFKKFLVKQLGIIPSFYSDITLYGSGDTLPGCLNDDMEAPPGYGIFPPIGLLGTFYEMDGNLPDAKKCYKIQLEMSSSPNFWSNKFEEVNVQCEMKEQEPLTKKYVEKESKKPQTDQQTENSKVEEELKKMFLEIRKFENGDFQEYISSKISRNELKEKLKKDILRYRFVIEKQTGKKQRVPYTMYDKIKTYHAKDENRKQIRKNQTDWDYLSLGEKISFLDDKIRNKEIKKLLDEINDIRNSLSHSGDYYPDAWLEVFADTRLCIKKCKDFFEFDVKSDIKRI